MFKLKKKNSIKLYVDHKFMDKVVNNILLV